MFDDDSLERELSCGICLEPYSDPLQLPCMHSFCKECLVAMLAASSNKKLKCPDCRKIYDLGRRGIGSLKRNFKLSSIVEIYRQAVERQATNNDSGAVSEGARCAKDKDYDFLNKVIQSSRHSTGGRLEPHVADHLWGTFRRAGVGKRPAPPPPPEAAGASTSSSSSPQIHRTSVRRPLPPLPTTEDGELTTTSSNRAPLPAPRRSDDARSETGRELPSLYVIPPVPMGTDDDRVDYQVVQFDGSFDLASVFSSSQPHNPVTPRRRAPVPSPRGSVHLSLRQAGPADSTEDAERPPALPPRDHLSS